MRRCLVLAAALLAACTQEPASAPVAPEPEPESNPRREPLRIVVDHILIGVKSRDFPRADRDEEQARDFTYDLYKRLKAGESWDALKEAHSDDRQPGKPAGGPYAMANHGVAARRDQGEFERRGMVQAFGDTGFALEVGEIAIAEYGPGSKYGFHIIQRVK